MDSVYTDKLVREYKTTATPRRKNDIFTVLIKEYHPIIHKLIKNFKLQPDDYNDMIAIAHSQLYKAMLEFDLTKPIKFNTFCFYYLRAIPRLFMRDRRDLKVEIQESYSPEGLYNYNLDLTKLLSEREILIFGAYINGKVSANSALTSIKGRLINYVEAS